MSEKFKLPSSKGVVFWPIGTGDSTTLVLKPGEVVVQIDLRHLEKAEGDSHPEWPIVDHLVDALPKIGGKPYLAAFVLTHPDQDHIQGFGELLEKVHIGEIWHTPKVFRDQQDHEALCEDAVAFRDEVHRRRKAIIAAGGVVESGDRLRVIGHDDLLEEAEYKDLPDECKSRPGAIVESINGGDLSDSFTAFIHAPFKEDQAKDRNKTSLSLNVTIAEGEKRVQFFFFGDREYQTIKRIFEVTEAFEKNVDYLKWNVMLSAHHCSKAVMYWQGENDESPKFQKDVMDYFEKYAEPSSFVIASALSNFTDEKGKDPPHKKARKRYEEIVDTGRFICTHEYPDPDDTDNPEPIVFTIDDSEGLCFEDSRAAVVAVAGLASVGDARGTSEPPQTVTEFGAKE